MKVTIFFFKNFYGVLTAEFKEVAECVCNYVLPYLPSQFTTTGEKKKKRPSTCNSFSFLIRSE